MGDPTEGRMLPRSDKTHQCDGSGLLLSLMGCEEVAQGQAEGREGLLWLCNQAHLGWTPSSAFQLCALRGALGGWGQGVGVYLISSAFVCTTVKFRLYNQLKGLKMKKIYKVLAHNRCLTSANILPPTHPCLNHHKEEMWGRVPR